MESTRAVPAGELKAKYVAMLKAQGRPFGYIVRSAGDPVEMVSSTDTLDTAMMSSIMTAAAGGPRIGPPIIRAVKVLPDGSEQPVRGLTFANVQHTSYRNIAEASRERSPYTCRATPSMMGISALTAMSGRTSLVSMIVPNLLFEELEIQRVKEASLKPPVVPSPMKKQ
jgi:hypothetical protein